MFNKRFLLVGILSAVLGLGIFAFVPAILAQGPGMMGRGFTTPFTTPDGAPQFENFGPGAMIGNGAFGGPGAMRGGQMGYHSPLVYVAEQLGWTVADLQSELTAGQTLAEVATANGLDVTTLIEGLLAQRAEQMAWAVDNGRLTQEDVDSHMATMRTQLETMFTSPWDGTGFFGANGTLEGQHPCPNFNGDSQYQGRMGGPRGMNGGMMRGGGQFQNQTAPNFQSGPPNSF